MGRKKSLPVRSVRIQPGIIQSGCAKEDEDPNTNTTIDGLDVKGTEKNALSRHCYVEIDKSNWTSDEHFDIAEIILRDIRMNDEPPLSEDPCETSNINLRFKLHEEDRGKLKMGYPPVLSADSIYLEFLSIEKSKSENMEISKVLFSGSLDGPGESLCGLVHLVSLKFMTLRLTSPIRFLGANPSIILRVEILRNAFEACESLVEIIRRPWWKSMVNVMAWLRPEVTTSEVKYGFDSVKSRSDVTSEAYNEGVESSPTPLFDAAGFYEAIKPSKNDPMLEDDLPELIPQLRPYQRRAVYWMIQREKGLTVTPDEMMNNQSLSPFCVPVPLLNGTSLMFYNPFGGNVSLHSDFLSSYVPGGILADEMGLGKTVELLACVLVERRLHHEDNIISEGKSEESGVSIKRLKKERVECVCGAVTESTRYSGLWVQCDTCDAWQHADCVGYSPSKKPKYLLQNSRKRRSATFAQPNEDYICSVCSELVEAATSMVKSHATLIVCPSPILMQWHSELMRHTKPGFLKIKIYEGAKNLSFSADLRAYVNELSSSDIVLTTYDVLKEDLSHDSDRHEGDRRCMRFQKRYPVVPTLLTKILWWRLCLDEAQMVESTGALGTEMALRLRAQYRWCITGTPIQRSIDDLYGLLRFLRASPFDIFKWWANVIRDPYEKKDEAAMQFTHNFFKKILWRSSKVHVSDELHLPPQQEFALWLTFSPIEEHFYQKQHETCTRHAVEAVERFKKDTLTNKSTSDFNRVGNCLLSHVDAAMLLAPLLKLRQACCHPQVGSSGLRSLQHSPMTMDEILEVLIGKSKIEGEEALRKVIVALNGLAGIACIEKDYERASSLYRESLSIAEEHSDDFRVDPLLRIHVYHNLADLIPSIQTFKVQNTTRVRAKKRKSKEHINLGLMGVHAKEKNVEPVVDSKVSSALYDENHLRKICEDIIQKYLSIFSSKLSIARQEFLSTHTQVCDLSKDFSDLNVTWWLEVLNLVEKNTDSSDDLMRKIDHAVSRTVNSAEPSSVSSRYRSISGLKLIIQSGLDSLETSRRSLITQLMEIDKHMEHPKEADILRVRFCPSCQSGNGSLCVHCELNDVFQEYEARLFHLKKGNHTMASAEEAIDSQKRKNNLNHFFRESKNFTENWTDNSKNKGQRHINTNVVVYRLPSDLELILGVIKRYSKSLTGLEVSSSARRHLLLFEAMRKEFANSRSLSSAQAQVLSAHDEIKMSISRLCLRENEDEPTAVNVLSPDELVPSSMQFSNEKFSSLSSLERIKGQLRYLKGLAVPRKKAENVTNPSNATHNDPDASLPSACSNHESNQQFEADDNLCPICHDKLTNQKMVFQCGHAMCCKCCLKMTDHALHCALNCQKKWIMCPTCRQQTDFRNIAYVDDNLSREASSLSENEDFSERSLKVVGSYGTKIEAIVRRTLRILSSDQHAKLLVFSSWNDVLNILEHAFHDNSINYVRMKGGRKSQEAMERFKGTKLQAGPTEVQVMLLLIQHGANGLNILEAQHVILVEPLLNPATEAQAINRVHRIGQDKETFVHRFIVKGTVEESIHNLNRSRDPRLVVKGRSKGQDQPAFTLKDIETLLQPIPGKDSEEESSQVLPPGVAAAMAAKRRLMEGNAVLNS